MARQHERSWSEYVGDLRSLRARQAADETWCAQASERSVWSRLGVVPSEDWRCALARRRDEFLIARELPLILRAYQLAARGAARELVALDRGLTIDAAWRGGQESSGAFGRAQLRKMSSMRDQRVVRRYGEAVEAGEAKGWHVVVYGMVLCLYALPLRQGLLHFARSDLEGCLMAAQKHVNLSARERQEACDALYAVVPAAVDALLPPIGGYEQAEGAEAV